MPVTIFFKDWLFGKLPQYFKDNDTYVDLNGEGLLERYLRNYGDELDENIMPFINDFLDLFDAAKCQATLLPHLSFLLGIPITIDDTEATYRKVLKYAIQLYKVKGTEPSYQMLFNFIGLDISVIEDTPQTPVTYDADPMYIYDEPTGVRQYDTSCASCSGYTIAYNANLDPLNPNSVSPALLTIAQKIICYLQPINATFKGFAKRLNIYEPFIIDIEETTSLSAFEQTPGEFSDDFSNTDDFA